MSEEQKTVAVCGYRQNADGEVEAKVFQLPEDKQQMPQGWRDTPAKFKKVDVE